MGRTSIFELDVDTLFRAGALFTARGFSYSTIKALVLAGIDAPERLLFADDADLRSITRLDDGALEEIARYRTEFSGTKPTWRPVFNGLGGIFVSAVQQKPQARRVRTPSE
jgi:hypothetical protein